MFNLLEAFLGLKQNEWILLGATLAAVILILITIVLVAKARKNKRAKVNDILNETASGNVIEESPVDKSPEQTDGETIAEHTVEQATTAEPIIKASASKEFVEEELAEGELETEAATDVAEEEAVDKHVFDQNVENVEQQKAKPINKVYHIAKRRSDGRWQVKIAKGAKAIKLFLTQAEAITYAKKLAVSQDAKIIIHKEDGSFRKLTYKSKK